MKCRLLHIRIIAIPLVCATVFLLMNVSACSKRSSTTGGGPSTNFDRFEGIATDLEKATAVIIYEGLPNPFGIDSSFETETKRADIITLNNEKFYDQKLTLSQQDFTTLKQLFSSSSSFSKWAGPKGCGGFHSDWCFEWQTPNGTYQSFVCFNCTEVKFFGGSELYCDINHQPAKNLKQLLEAYRINRPKGGSYESILTD